LEVSDDGRGIDPEKLKAKALASGTLTQEQAARMTDREALGLIFGSGFSTAKEVSEVSGRGVGMDIVRSNLSKLGGIIDLDSKVGEGTRFTLRLPLTLAIIRGLLVCVHGRVYVLPLGTVVETLLLKDDEVQCLNRKEVIVLRGVTTPLIRLSEKFQASSKQNGPKSETSYVVIVGLADQRVGLVVDELIGEQEVVIKSLSRYVGDCPGLSGATILGDGNVALIVDVNSLVPMDRG
jgi:two-component system chemotaxis sensor kinase CheA